MESIATLTSCKILHSDCRVMRFAARFVTCLAALIWLAVILLSLLLLARPAQAIGLEVTTVANLPDCTNGSPWVILVVDGASATDCATGASTTEVVCTCKDGVIAGLSTSGGASNSFETINVPSGTDPVADSSADTLNLTSGAAALTITGTSGTDTIDFDISGTSSRCARFDGSGELVPASADCSAGDVNYPIILDIGDDGGNDSTALNEIATENDDYSVLIEESNNKATIRFDRIPPYRQYDPNRPPTTCATCDEFTGDTTSLTFTCAGNADVTQTYSTDSMRFQVTGDSSAVDRYICTFAAPSGSWVFSTKVRASFLNTGIPMCGIVVIRTGTQTVPTALTQLIVFDTGGVSAVMQTATSLTSGTADVGSSDSMDWMEAGAAESYLQVRYDATADTLTGCVTYSGFPGINCPIQTSVTADPPYIGFLIDDLTNLSGTPSADCFFDFVRVRTDATGTSDPYPIGEF